MGPQHLGCPLESNIGVGFAFFAYCFAQIELAMSRELGLIPQDVSVKVAVQAVIVSVCVHAETVDADGMGTATKHF